LYCSLATPQIQTCPVLSSTSATSRPPSGSISRIDLAEQLWDSLESSEVEPGAEQIAELRLRRVELASGRDTGDPWQIVLGEIEQRGA